MAVKPVAIEARGLSLARALHTNPLCIGGLKDATVGYKDLNAGSACFGDIEKRNNWPVELDKLPWYFNNKAPYSKKHGALQENPMFLGMGPFSSHGEVYPLTTGTALARRPTENKKCAAPWALTTDPWPYCLTICSLGQNFPDLMDAHHSNVYDIF